MAGFSCTLSLCCWWLILPILNDLHSGMWVLIWKYSVSYLLSIYLFFEMLFSLSIYSPIASKPYCVELGFLISYWLTFHSISGETAKILGIKIYAHHRWYHAHKSLQHRARPHRRSGAPCPVTEDGRWGIIVNHRISYVTKWPIWYGPLSNYKLTT